MAGFCFLICVFQANLNPLDETITVFTLPENASVYEIHGVYDRSSVAESALLPGFAVDVDACFAEGEQ